MQFTTPTTKNEMYSVLNDIYLYYRQRVDAYTDLTLSPLNLSRMSFTPLSDLELAEKAQTLLAPKQQIRLTEYVDSVTEKKTATETELAALNGEYNVKLFETEKYYEDAKETLKGRAIKSGVTASGIYAEKLIQLEKEKGEKIAALNAEKTAKTSALNTKIQHYASLITGAQNKYATVCAQEVLAKVTELKDEQDKTVRYVFEYNNALDEKEQRYENTRKQTSTGTQLRYLEIRVTGFTKDELVSKGYYADVILCVKSYYDTLTPSDALADVKNEPQLAIYLEDYYKDIIYYYQIRAGVNP